MASDDDLGPRATQTRSFVHPRRDPLAREAHRLAPVFRVDVLHVARHGALIGPGPETTITATGDPVVLDRFWQRLDDRCDALVAAQRRAGRSLLTRLRRR